MTYKPHIVGETKTPDRYTYLQCPKCHQDYKICRDTLTEVKGHYVLDCRYSYQCSECDFTIMFEFEWVNSNYHIWLV